MSHHRTGPKLPVIPDLRFEQSYLRSIASHVQVSDAPAPELDFSQEDTPFIGKSKGKEKALNVANDWTGYHIVDAKKDAEGVPPPRVATAEGKAAGPASGLSSTQVVKIDWVKVAWVTSRDQMISPLLQGAIWGVASHFLRPFMALVGLHVRLLFSSSSKPTKEGAGAGWLRNWVKSLGIGTGLGFGPLEAKPNAGRA